MKVARLKLQKFIRLRSSAGLVAAIILLGLLFGACHVQKRHYTKGYYMQRDGSATPAGEVVISDTSARPASGTTGAGARRTVVGLARCDTLVFLNGQSAAVRITSVSYKKITFRRCEADNAAETEVRRSELQKIIYRDGSYVCVKPCMTESPIIAPDNGPGVSADSCMLILRRNGKRIRGRIVQTDADAIYYVSCDKDQQTPIRLETQFIAKIVSLGGQTDSKQSIERKPAGKRGDDVPWWIFVVIAFCLVFAVGFYLLIAIAALIP
jgi:hypothetical protein